MIERRADEEQKTRRHQVKYSIRVLVTTTAGRAGLSFAAQDSRSPLKGGRRGPAMRRSAPCASTASGYR
jgi:hypothetical protein